MNKPSSFTRDFKPRSNLQKRANPKHHILLAFTIAILIAAGASLTYPKFANAKLDSRSLTTNQAAITSPSQLQAASDNTTATDNLQSRHLSIPLPKTNAVTPGQPSTISTAPIYISSNRIRDFLPEGTWQEITIKDGDSIALAFDRAGISPQQLFQLLDINKKTKRILTRIHPGAVLRLNVSDDGKLQKLVYEIDITHTFYIARLPEEGFTPHLEERQLEVRTARASGTIKDSLFLSAQEAGLPDALTMELAAIFGWDIDFALDIRRGDRFSLIYEELYLHGNKVRNGTILAAEFISQDKSYRAIRYTDASKRTDYYSPDGKSMRKAFLRTPVDFARISSRYNNKRRHPVLNKIRAHKGVDYAAPRGTPIRATGDGKIVHRGRKGGYGNTIVIRHGSRYNTLYAHMSSYARGMYNGKRIKQGQIIGYVGSTGLATGPHLHYEFHVNGAHRNPLTVRLPDAAPLNKAFRINFEQHVASYMAQLDILNRISLAMNSSQ